MSDGKAYKSDLKGLLRFSMDHTNHEDAQNVRNHEMDAEKKKFLESVLSSMTTDVTEEFEKAIAILDDPTSKDCDKVEALNVIRERIDNIDFANSFVNAGGSIYLFRLLNHSNSELKSISAYIIAEMSQNNPFCQKYFVDSNTTPRLMELLKGTTEVASSGLHAISSLIQNYEPGLAAFINSDGVRLVIACCLNGNHSRLFVRACFLIEKLSKHEALRDQIVEQSAVTNLIDNLPDTFVSYDTSLEVSLAALCELLKSKKCVINGDLRGKLIFLARNIVQNKEALEYEEITGYAKEIIERMDT